MMLGFPTACGRCPWGVALFQGCGNAFILRHVWHRYVSERERVTTRCEDRLIAHLKWMLNDWTPELFTDESRFCVNYTDTRVQVLRSSSGRFASVFVANHDRSGGGSVMVWAGTSMWGKWHTDGYTIPH